MPMYPWKCDECGTFVDVWRPMADHKAVPEKPCTKCGGSKWVRRVHPVAHTGPKGKGHWQSVTIGDKREE